MSLVCSYVWLQLRRIYLFIYYILNISFVATVCLSVCLSVCPFVHLHGIAEILLDLFS
jgi:hypothetical protein